MDVRAIVRAASRGTLLMGGGVLTLLSCGLLTMYATSPANAEVEANVDAETPRRAASAESAAATELLDRTVTLRLGDHSVTRSWRELGAVALDGPTPVGIDPEAAIAALTELKRGFDVPPANAKLDLEHRRMVPEVAGRGVDVYGALAALRWALRAGDTQVTLPTASIGAEVTADDLDHIDIGHVLGRFVTKFPVTEKSRNENLKLAASKLDGHILMPGVEFSFNDVVGDRTEREGYKIAHVITEGEMVDGLAGGTCQISTTLHGAAFFAGIEILRGLPHSRPSVYVPMGLDATVVYPVTDLKLRNRYDFPVVIHYKVARGEAIVEILGQQRPYDQVVFEREIVEEEEFETVTREDVALPVGSMVIDQEGFPGYKLKRYRRYYNKGKLVKTDTWNLRYRPVTEYARIGINPDPNLPQPEQEPSHGPTPPKDKLFKLADPYL
jgi:vancomycin resistance protein YoaR